MISIEQKQTTENFVYTKKKIEEIVKLVRLELYNRGLHCRPRAIKKRLEEYYGINLLPSESTIGRILSRHGLTYGRTGFYR